VWGIIASMFIGNAILLIMNVPMARYWAKIATVPFELLFPIIVLISVVGAYTVNNSLWDVGLMVFFGIMGYFMKKLDMPMAPIVLTFVLGKMMEASLLQSLTMFHGSFIAIFQRPIAGTLLAFAVIIIAISLFSGIKRKRDIFSSDVEM
jgi:putative tricarboxylic transport membrane protein